MEDTEFTIFMFILFLSVLSIAALNYVLKSLAFARVGTRLDPKTPEYSYWIPFYRMYLIESLSLTLPELEQGNTKIFNFDAPAIIIQWWFLIRTPLISAMSVIPFIGSIAGLAIDVIIKTFVYARLFVYMNHKNPYTQIEDEIPLGIASAVCPFLGTFVLLLGNVNSMAPIRDYINKEPFIPNGPMPNMQEGSMPNTQYNSMANDSATNLQKDPMQTTQNEEYKLSTNSAIE